MEQFFLLSRVLLQHDRKFNSLPVTFVCCSVKVFDKSEKQQHAPLLQADQYGSVKITSQSACGSIEAQGTNAVLAAQNSSTLKSSKFI